MKIRLLIAAAVAPFLLAACGGSDDNGDAADQPSTPSSSAPSSPTDATSPTDVSFPTDGSTTSDPADDETAIETTLTQFLLAPRCDLATPQYLKQRSLFGGTAKENCEELENTFVQPQFTAEDIVYTNLQVDGDVATVEVGSDLINITTKYQLTKVDGTWLVSGDEYNSDL